MSNPGRCPYCEELITRVRAEPIAIYDESPTSWAGISYICPRCSKILSVSMDPTNPPEGPASS